MNGNVTAVAAWSACVARGGSDGPWYGIEMCVRVACEKVRADAQVATSLTPFVAPPPCFSGSAPAMALAGKLFYFVIERAAEPVSNILERQAASKSPIFRSACMRLARWQSRFEYNREVRRVVKMQKDAGIEPEPGHAHWVPTDDIEPPPELSEEEATQKGAELLGEGGRGTVLHGSDPPARRAAGCRPCGSPVWSAMLPFRCAARPRRRHPRPAPRTASEPWRQNAGVQAERASSARF